MVGSLILDSNLRLDQIRGNKKKIDFKEIYEGDDATSEDGSESPLTQTHVHCEYYEPKQFNNVCDGFQNSTSYFHINTCSLSKKNGTISRNLYMNSRVTSFLLTL
jgi:hypothetical protein